ncbi:hypothetical protein BHM03_00034825 [Ensete ventricosum]|nr:hypothetical protein BHM03_00034825 [Ensete ventricosum]
MVVPPRGPKSMIIAPVADGGTIRPKILGFVVSPDTSDGIAKALRLCFAPNSAKDSLGNQGLAAQHLYLILGSAKDSSGNHASATQCLRLILSSTKDSPRNQASTSQCLRLILGSVKDSPQTRLRQLNAFALSLAVPRIIQGTRLQ